MKPADYEEGKTYPAILHIHGGPRTVFSDVFHHEMQIWANAGYFVFFSNPRGSDGRGTAFGDINGIYGTVDYANLMEFTDKVLEAYPMIDTARVGVTGGSYGGFMTNWIIGNTTRFAAAASQRSISNWVSKCMTTDIGYYFNMEKSDVKYGVTTSKGYITNLHVCGYNERNTNGNVLYGVVITKNEGDVVLDPFSGSGTTAKMAMLNKRNYIGFEINPEYYEVSLKRVGKYVDSAKNEVENVVTNDSDGEEITLQVNDRTTDVELEGKTKLFNEYVEELNKYFNEQTLEILKTLKFTFSTKSNDERVKQIKEERNI